MQICSYVEGTGLEDWHLGIGDIELVHKDVGPDKVLGEVQSKERGGAAVSLSFAASRSEGDRERSLGRSGWRRRV